MTRKICIVTGTRAEYGLLRWIMEAIKKDPDLTLQVIATGMHLSPEFGLTYRYLEADGFAIDRKVEMLVSSDTPVGIAKSIGLGTIGFADALAELAPDILVLLGDRFEILSAATAAMVARVPIAHLHGGEATEGLIDEAIRHSLTKMAHLHFVAAEDYRHRVIQLGEQQDRVFLVGGLGVDALNRLPTLARADLEQELQFKLLPRNLLVAFHPVTLENASAEQQMQELLAALDGCTDTGLVFTLPNADTYGRVLINMIEHFVEEHANARAFPSLGQLKFFSCMAHFDGILGNSSSGLLEAPSFRIGTIDIGDRQRGRLKAESVISCVPERSAIEGAIEKLYSAKFRESLHEVRNPYGDGGASEKVVATLKKAHLESILKKSFYDVDFPCA